MIVGLEKFMAQPPGWASRAGVGVLTHPAAVDRSFRPAAEQLVSLFGSRLKALFGPQHGFEGEKQDNMIASPDFRHPLIGVPVFSLYGPRQKPDEEMLAGIEVMLVDLQDVGCRIYTYIQTLSLVMEACAEQDIKVVVLDRPNPIGRVREGNLLDDDCRSFVGLNSLPMRHGLTIGEVARLLVGRGCDCHLEVVPLDGYDPAAYFDKSGREWVMPSPNMPTLQTAVVYPGQVIFEGTELSEGRGTTRPFEMVGAPFIDPYRLADRLADYRLAGAVFRPVYFEPTFNKHARRLCGGVFLHVTDRGAFRPYHTSLTLLQAVAQLWPDEFRFTEPPYEYETVRRPMDLILGRSNLADQLVHGDDPAALETGWADELADFSAEAESYHLY